MLNVNSQGFRPTLMSFVFGFGSASALTGVPTCPNSSVRVLCVMTLFLVGPQASATVAIPKEHHRFVIGKNGEKLQELELKTATKIAIPRPDDPCANIRITGTKEGIEKARHEILLISAEQVRDQRSNIRIGKRIGVSLGTKIVFLGLVYTLCSRCVHLHGPSWSDKPDIKIA